MTYPLQTILAVWAKGAEVEGIDPARWRKDSQGAWMRFEAYGDHSSPYGWEIDHTLLSALGQARAADVLLPVQWQHHAARHRELAQGGAGGAWWQADPP